MSFSYSPSLTTNMTTSSFGKMDVCLWAKNSASLLPRTLRRFDEVVPREVINSKIMVDDHSEDGTVAIGEGNGWHIYENPGTGVASAANEALRHVSTDYFISVEHDILLAKNWWPKVLFDLLKDDTVAVAQGVRVFANPTLRSISKERLPLEQGIDNNIYRTEIIRRVGGFPDVCTVCTDVWLRKNVENAGFKWIIDPSVVSEHIRLGVMHEVSHRVRLHRLCTCKRWHYSTKYMLRLTLTSPASGLKMALRDKTPQAAIAYPFLRLRILQAHLASNIRNRE